MEPQLPVLLQHKLMGVMVWPLWDLIAKLFHIKDGRGIIYNELITHH